MMEKEQNSHLGLELRLTVSEDASLLYLWRNRPEIIQSGLSGRAVTSEEHAEWFAETLVGGVRKLFIIQHEDVPVGQVRYDFDNDNSAEVSIYLLPEYTGRGWGVWALLESCRLLACDRDKCVNVVTARICAENKSSLKAFHKAGFSLDPNSATGHVNMFRCLVQVPHNRLTYGEDEVDAVAKVVRTGQWVGGPEVARLEKELSEWFGVHHAVCVGSGLGALRLAIKACGGSDRTVGVPAYSCVALANAALSCGAQPLAFDVQTDTWNLDPEQVQSAFAPDRPEVVIAVNTFGCPADIGALASLGSVVVEDCSHGFQLAPNGLPVLGPAHATIISFYATKLVGAGEGGAVLTNDAEVAAFIRSWRDYSDQAPDGSRLNDKMSDVGAALARCQLRRLPDLIKRRQELADRYHAQLSKEDALRGRISLPQQRDDRVWYRYAIEVPRGCAAEIAGQLAVRGVMAAQPVSEWKTKNASVCTNAERAYNNLLSLPLYPRLTDVEQKIVIASLTTVIKEMKP